MNDGGSSSMMDDVIRLMVEHGTLPDEATVEEAIARLSAAFPCQIPGFSLVLRAAFRAGWDARHQFAWRREIERARVITEPSNQRAEQ